MTTVVESEPVSEPGADRDIECIKNDICQIHSNMNKNYTESDTDTNTDSNTELLQLFKQEDLLYEELEKAYVNMYGRKWFDNHRIFIIQNGLRYLICYDRGCGDCINCYGELEESYNTLDIENDSASPAANT